MTRPLWLASFVPVLCLCACGGGGLTEFFVCYSIDEELVNPQTRVTVCARDDQDALVFGCDGVPLASSALDGIASQGFVQSEARAVRIELVGMIDRDVGGIRQIATVSQAIELDFDPGRVVDVSLHIAAACLGRPCAADETCVRGACIPTRIPNARCYSEHDQPPVSSSVCDDPRLSTSCFAP